VPKFNLAGDEKPKYRKPVPGSLAAPSLPPEKEKGDEAEEEHIPQDVFKPLHPLESPDLRHDPADLDPFSLPIPEKRAPRGPSTEKKPKGPAKQAEGKKHVPEKEKPPAHDTPSPGASEKDSGARIRISEPEESPVDPGSRDPFSDPESLRAEIVKEVAGAKTDIKPEKSASPSEPRATSSLASGAGDADGAGPEETPLPEIDENLERMSDFEVEQPIESVVEPHGEIEPPAQALEEQAAEETDKTEEGNAGGTLDLAEEKPPDSSTGNEEVPEEEIPEEIAAIQEIKEEQRSRSRFTWFWIILILLAVLLVTTWYVGWLPKAYTYISSLLETQKTERAPTPGTTETASKTTAASAESPYEYYLQVSSWREMKNAEKQKEALASQGFPAVVESHFVESKGATYYRVRLGPLESRGQALELKAKLGAAVPSEAFVDSVLKPGHSPPLPRPVQTRPAGARTKDETGTYIPKHISEPGRGWAISVGAYSNPRTADREAEKLQRDGGLPAFISVTRRDGEEWYRVQVGPFEKEDDAKRYLQLVRVTYNVDAYIRRLR